MKTQTDHQTYQDLQQAMRDMLRAGMFNTLAFEDAWRMSEAIKNRHGGFPPLPEDIDDENQILAETGVEMGIR